MVLRSCTVKTSLEIELSSLRWRSTLQLKSLGKGAFVGGLFLFASAAIAQHGHPETPPRADEETSVHGHEHHHSAAMVMSEDPLQLGMSREGSGTAWQPDSTPVHGHHFMIGDWMLMLHYNIIAGYDAQTSSRGDHQFMSVNWVMLMAQHSLLDGQFTARAMLSAEPFTTGGKSGYPLLLQTGEAVDGMPLHDRQHPHDLFMETAVKYNHALADGIAYEIYLAFSGEPALGPVAFPHRESSSANPFAVLGHHWQDSTHISFGVVTAAVYTRQFKLEGSWFNGREPDENRYDFDFRALDSFSTRLSFNPNSDLSFQVSYGFLKSPEQLDPDRSVHRVTASATHNWPLGEGNWATTAVFGLDAPSLGPNTTATTLESNFELSHNTVFGRAEFVQRSGDDLALPQQYADSVFDAFVLELGYVRDVPIGPVLLGFGIVGSANFLSGGVQPYYGSNIPLGGMAFIRLRPEKSNEGHHH